MRIKSVPPAPDSIDVLAEVQRATPLVPEPEESCCVRVASRMEWIDKDEARRWLAFMRALGLVEAGELGYVRTRVTPDPATLKAPFRSNIFGVEEIRTALKGSSSVTPEAAFEALRPTVPQWERHRNPGTWEYHWQERVTAILEWSCLFGLAERTDEGYRLAKSSG